jgi:Asp-tRNA(Asn)/Glu-tRNA(Gln) amidotransferase A subunit family amidase
MNDIDLCYLSAGDALTLFSSRDLSPVELMKAVLRRIESINPSINAFGDCYFETALSQARGAERRWSDGSARVLEGVPLAVKDAQNIAGKRTTFGSPVYRSNIAQRSDPMIERLLAAGAIVHARTTVSEFCFSGVCISSMWGTTFNPWNTDFSPGGSSGGSGAALAAGMTLLATGTDIGGSIRVPASACGVVGYKPPHGRNPHAPPFNMDRLNHCGPLARCVADISLVQSVVAGQHPADHDSLRDSIVYPRLPQDVGGLRVAWSLDFAYRVVDAEVRRNTERAISRFRDIGCATQEVNLDWSGEIDDIVEDWYRAAPIGQMILKVARETPHLLSADLRRLAQIWLDRPSNITRVFELIGRMSDRFAAAIEGFDVFVCPTMSIPAVPAAQSMWDDGFEIEGRRVNPEYGHSMTHQFNLLGNCPVISVPSGLSRSGVPTGLQIVGRPFDDLTVIKTALAFERATKPWYGQNGARPQLIDGETL